MNELKSVTFNINKRLTLEIYDPKQLTMNGQLWHFITTSRSIRILFCSSLFWLRRIFCLRVKVIIVCKLSNAIQTVTEHCTASTDRRCKYLNDYVTVQHRSVGEKNCLMNCLFFLTVTDVPVNRAIHCIHGVLTTSA